MESDVRAMACPKCEALPHHGCTGPGINRNRMHAERWESAEDALNRAALPSTSYAVETSGKLGWGFSGGRRILPAKGCE